MTADNIVYGVDFKAKQRERAIEELSGYSEYTPVTVSGSDTSPCETNPVPFVAPEWDGA